MNRRKNGGRQRIELVLEILENTYPNAATQLQHQNPFQLLMATMLSAQTTDKQVNKVTPELFRRFPDAKALAVANLSEIEDIVKTCGFYKTKAKNLKEACRIMAEKYNNRVPDKLEELTSLPGVGRKTANVVLSNAFGVDAIAVDTHVFRVSNRLGLAKAKDAREAEEQLMENIPKEKWSRAHHWLIHHGRNICKARRPECNECPLSALCPYHNEK